VGKLAEGGSLAGVHHVEDYSHMVGLSRLEGVALRGSSAGLHPMPRGRVCVKRGCMWAVRVILCQRRLHDAYTTLPAAPTVLESPQDFIWHPPAAQSIYRIILDVLDR